MQQGDSGSRQTEEAVLGCLMLDASRGVDINLSPLDFTIPHHQEMFRAIATCIEQRKPADAVTVSELLDTTTPSPKKESWLQMCVTIVKNTPSAANLHTYVDIVRKHSEARKVKQVAGALIEDIDADPTALDRAMYALTRMSQGQREYECAIGDTLGELVDYIDYRSSHRDELPGRSTGLPKLDKNTGGLCNGHLIVVAARPGMGKTAMMAALHLANRDVASGIMSAEMARQELVMRMVCTMAEVNFTDLKMGTVPEHKWPEINQAFATLRKMPLYINDKSAPTIDQIARQARRWKYDHDIKLFSMDYLQRIPTPPGIRQRHEGVEYIARSMKEIARELDIPVVALSAVSREVESRQDKRPLMNDLRDSGAIEAEADIIITIYRPEVYSDEDKFRGLAELAVIKNRHGSLGKCTVSYHGPTLTFSPFRVGSGDDGPGGVSGGDGAAGGQVGIRFGEDDRLENRGDPGAKRTRKSFQEIHSAARKRPGK